MSTRIPATRLARRLGDVLGRIRYRGESFLVERNGTLVAKIGPVRPDKPATLREVADAWGSVEADGDFARDLAAVGDADRPARNPWA